MRRAGARAGDGIWVTGTIGDGALGLLAAPGRIDDPAASWPTATGCRGRGSGWLAGLAAAAMDVSDGLVQDLGHLCRASGLGARIDADGVPLSDAARSAGRLALCLTGGDDYELAFALPDHRERALRAAAETAGIPVTRIGRFEAGEARVRVFAGNGVEMAFPAGGWSHFGAMPDDRPD